MKIKYLGLFCIFVLMSISCAFAQDNSSAMANGDLVCDAPIANNSMNINSEYDSYCDFKTFDDLYNDIHNLHPGDTYNIDKDYIFTDDVYKKTKILLPHEGIEIAQDNVTINGNGHIIDGNFQSALFKVTGVNIKICNLTFTRSYYEGFNIPFVKYDVKKIPGPVVEKVMNAKYQTDMSAVCWLGDNGCISDCVFSDNSAINGGAISWMGNNGVINNSIFKDNIARGIGGAIYIGSVNNTVISNCLFKNSTSLSNEAIYIDRKHGTFTFINNTYDRINYKIDGNFTGINVDYLHYNAPTNIWPDEKENFICLLFKSVTLGGINFIDNNTFYFSQYNNKTQSFVFSAYKIYDSMEYLKEFYFSNITCYNDVLNEILNENYKTYTKQIANIFINDNNDYNKFIRNEFLKPTFLSLNDKNQSYVLNVFFTKTLSINSNSEMNINNRGYDIINLFGNNTKIYAESGKRDENKWVSLDNENLVFTVSNMKIEGFNTAIENKCSSIILVNVTLNNNIMDYIIDADWGAAILNAGLCQCYDCTFTNNYCCNGGAIFNQGVLELENCTFKGNTAYGKGNDVLNVDKGTVILNTEKVVGSKGPISYEESISTGMAKFYTYLAAIGTISVAVLTTVLVSIACGGNVIAGAAAGGIVGSAISGSIGTGVAVGLTVGAGAALLFGSWTAYEINSQTYNIYHDRVQTAKQCIGGALMCAATGAAIGGVFSYGILASYAANANSIIATQTGNVEMINEPKGGEYTYESNGVTLKSPDALDKKIVDNIVNHVLSGEEEGNGNLIKEIVIDGKEVRATDNYRTINNIKITQEVTYEYKVYFKDGIIGYGDGTYPYIDGVADLNIVKSLDKPLNFIDGVADLTTAKSWEP